MAETGIDQTATARQRQVATCIDWFAEGQALAVEVGGVVVTVRLVGRRGRRSRLAIAARPTATFRSVEQPDAN